MVNEVVLDYLRKYSGQFDLKSLKQKILSAGYTEQEFNEAYSVLHSNNFSTQLESSKMIKKEKHPEKAEEHKENLEKKPDVKIEGGLKGNKMIKLAGIFGILFLVFSVVSMFFLGKEIVGFILYFLSSICFGLFIYGFIVVGKRYNKRLIRIIGWLVIVVLILLLIFRILFFLAPDIFSGVLPAESFLVEGSGFDLDVLGTAVISVLIFLIVLVLVFTVLGILFGIGLIKLKDKVKYAKISGILTLIGAACLILGIGILFLFAAFIFGIVLLFKEGSKKRE